MSNKKPELLIPYPDLNVQGYPKKTLENFQAVLDEIGVSIAYDVISRRFTIVGMEVNEFNRCLTKLMSKCEYYDLNISKDRTNMYMREVGLSNQINPVLDYLNDWADIYEGTKDRYDYIKQLSDTLITNHSDINPLLKHQLVKTWIVSCAYIIQNNLDNPRNIQGLLVLLGGQGIGKTTWIKKLLPEKFLKYLKTGVQLDPTSKDSVYKATKYWLCELGELDGITKKEQTALKAFFTEDIDEMRKPYGTEPEEFPRLTAFYGTVNEREFLTDRTGNRRYWTVPIESIDFEALDELDINLLWGQAMMEARLLFDSPRLPEEFEAMLEESNKEMIVLSPLEVAVDVNFDWNEEDKSKWQELSATKIQDKIGVKVNRGLQGALTSRGAEYKRKKSGVVYLVPPFISTFNNGK